MRRRGVAQALVAACEGVAAAAGFPDMYIQAATILRDGGNPLGGWLSQEYKARAAALFFPLSPLFAVASTRSCAAHLLIILLGT
jgi:hypothetical protein